MKKCEVCGKVHSEPPPQVKEAAATLVRAVADDMHGDQTMTVERILELAAGLYTSITHKSASMYIDQANLPSEMRVLVGVDKQ